MSQLRLDQSLEIESNYKDKMQNPENQNVIPLEITKINLTNTQTSKSPNSISKAPKSTCKKNQLLADQTVPNSIKVLDNFGGNIDVFPANSIKSKTKDGAKAPSTKQMNIKNFLKPQTTASKLDEDVQMVEPEVPKHIEFQDTNVQVPVQVQDQDILMVEENLEPVVVSNSNENCAMQFQPVQEQDPSLLKSISGEWQAKLPEFQQLEVQLLQELLAERAEFKKLAHQTGQEIKNHQSSANITSILNLINEKINQSPQNNTNPEEVNPLLMKLVAHTIEQSQVPSLLIRFRDLSQKELQQNLKKSLQKLPLPPSFVKSIDITNLLILNAIRKPYGLPPLTSDIYADKTESALWSWELVCPQLHLSPLLNLKVTEYRQIQHHKGKILKDVNKIVFSIKQNKSSAEIAQINNHYHKQFQSLQEFQAKQKAKSVKLQLKIQDEDLKQKRAVEEQRQKELFRVQKEQEKQIQQELKEKQLLEEKLRKEQLKIEKQAQKELQEREKEQARLQLLQIKEQEKLDRELKAEIDKKAKEEARLEKIEKEKREREEKKEQERIRLLQKKEDHLKSAQEAREREILAEQNRYRKLDNFFITQVPQQSVVHQKFPSLCGPTVACKIQKLVRDQYQLKTQYYTRTDLIQTLESIKLLTTRYFPDRASQKCIIIEDSAKQIIGSYHQKSQTVTGRNPFKQDQQINYDLDSEEELAEAQGEDLISNQNQEDEDDQDMLSSIQEGFMVSDGHLSDEEYNFSNENTDKKAEIEQRRQRYKQNQQQQKITQGQPIIQLKSDELIEFTAVCLISQFPISLQKSEKIIDTKSVVQYKFYLLCLFYNTLDAKQSILEEFLVKFPDCSKKSIEKLLREITVREKREIVVAYYATNECWAELTHEQQQKLSQLNDLRMQPLKEEAQREIDRRIQEQIDKEKLKIEREEQENKVKEEKRIAKEQDRLKREEIKEQDRIKKENDRNLEKQLKEQKIIEQLAIKEYEKQKKEEERRNLETTREQKRLEKQSKKLDKHQTLLTPVKGSTEKEEDSGQKPTTSKTDIAYQNDLKPSPAPFLLSNPIEIEVKTDDVHEKKMSTLKQFFKKL